MVRYCPGCGRSIPVDGQLCPYCGKDIEETCRAWFNYDYESFIEDNCPCCGRAVEVEVIPIPTFRVSKPQR